ncbi:MAG TPA: hypothetical protein VLS93_18955 [Anaeromyxobacteraceae bacterium]|nr:hypothetical protein [Anaeromyxobacteraceae bacterium]
MTPGRLARLRASTLVGVAALAFWAAAIPHAVARYFDGDPRGLLRPGWSFPHPAALEGAPMLDADGYDGQFFAALATDPLLLRPETPRMLDAPVYRAGRIGLPLLAWILAGGRDRAAVFVYQLLSWTLGVLAVWVVARWLEDEGDSPWWAASLVLAGGVVSNLMGSMPDLAGTTLMAFALWRHARGSAGVVPSLVGAALVRETSVIAAAAVAIAELRARRPWAAARAVGLPLLVLGAWRAYVIWRIGPDGLDVPGGNLALPLAWLPEKLAQPFDLAEVLALIGLGLSFAGLPALLPRIARWTPVETTYAGLAALCLLLSRLNYVVSWWGYGRTVLPLAFLSLVVAARARAAWSRWLFRAVALAWAGVGTVMLYRWAAGLAAALLVIAALRRGRRPAGAASA